jgi:hypothetical protein
VVAFQQPNAAASSFRRVGLQAVAFDPSKAVIPTPPKEKQPEEQKDLTIDMAGIALSVSSKYCWSHISILSSFGKLEEKLEN